MKICFIFDKTIKSKNLKKIIVKKYKKFSPQKADVIAIAGGDGFMLQSLKQLYKYNKPFYGINCGTFGFLMNKFIKKDIIKKIKNAKKISINPLEIQTINKNGTTKSLIAINELSLFRQSRQTSSIRLIIGKKTILKKLVSDGIVVSSPAGSTAYNLSIHGPILSLNSGKIAITPISPFRPRRWQGKVVSNKSEVTLINLDTKKRPLAAVADNVEVRNIKKSKVKINKKIKINLLYNNHQSLVKRIKKEQIIKKK